MVRRQAGRSGGSGRRDRDVFFGVTPFWGSGHGETDKAYWKKSQEIRIE